MEIEKIVQRLGKKAGRKLRRSFDDGDERGDAYRRVIITSLKYSREAASDAPEGIVKARCAKQLKALINAVEHAARAEELMRRERIREHDGGAAKKAYDRAKFLLKAIEEQALKQSKKDAS